jgi:hypothetical protein
MRRRQSPASAPASRPSGRRPRMAPSASGWATGRRARAAHRHDADRCNSAGTQDATELLPAIRIRADEAAAEASLTAANMTFCRSHRRRPTSGDRPIDLVPSSRLVGLMVSPVVDRLGDARDELGGTLEIHGPNKGSYSASPQIWRPAAPLTIDDDQPLTRLKPADGSASERAIAR